MLYYTLVKGFNSVAVHNPQATSSASRSKSTPPSPHTLSPMYPSMCDPIPIPPSLLSPPSKLLALAASIPTHPHQLTVSQHLSPMSPGLLWRRYGGSCCRAVSTTRLDGYGHDEKQYVRVCVSSSVYSVEMYPLTALPWCIVGPAKPVRLISLSQDWLGESLETGRKATMMHFKDF